MAQEENSNNQIFELSNSLSFISIERIFNKLIKFWFLFPLFLFISLSFSWYFIRYIKSNIYEVESIIYMGNEKSNVLPEQSVINFLWGGNVDKMYTQRSYLLSRQHNEKVVRKLNLFINYFEEGEIKKTNQYKTNFPFSVEIDTTHLQTIGSEYKIKPINNDYFELETINKGLSYSYESNSDFLKSNSYKKPVKLIKKDTLKYNVWLLNTNNKFKVIKNPSVSFYDNSTYSFILSDINSSIEKVKSNLNVSILAKDYSLIRVSKEGSNIDELVDIINTSINLSIDLQLDQKNRVPNNTIAFIEKELRNIHQKLQFTADKYEKTKGSEKIVDIGLQGANILAILNNLDQNIANLKTDIDINKQVLESIDNGTLSEMVSPVTDGGDQVYSGIIQRLSQLEFNRVDLLNLYQPQSDRVKELDIQINTLKKQAKSSLNQSIKSKTNRLNDLKSQIKKYESQLNKLPKKEQKFINVKRGYDLNSSIYTQMLKSLNASKVLKASNVSDVIVIDPAVNYGQYPIKPNRKIIYLIALIIGFIIPGVVILLIELLDNKIKVTKDITDISSIPITGTIGQMNIPDNKIVINRPYSMISESFRTLKSDINFLLSNKNIKSSKNTTLIISSTISGEGKTFLSINLASVFAMSGKKTIILGMDLRKPKLHTYFSISNKEGVSSYLVNASTLEDITLKTELDNLFLIPSGPIPPNPSELLCSEKTHLLIKQLKEEYDVLIIDSPPVGLVSDTFELSNHTDAFLYVVRKGLTTRNMLKTISDKYINKEIKNIGLVFNNYTPKRKGYGYGYGYGQGYFEEDETYKPNIWDKILKHLDSFLNR